MSVTAPRIAAWMKKQGVFSTGGNFPNIAPLLAGMMKEAMYHGIMDMRKQIEELQNVRTRKLGEVVTGRAWLSVIPEDALNWIDTYTPELVRVLEQSLLDKCRDSIAKGMRDGSTNEGVMKELSKTFDDFSRHRLEAIARTESMRGYNLGGLVGLKTTRGAVGVEFLAIMDERVTPECEARNGMRLRLDDPHIINNTPPLHPRCRSVLIPILDDEVDEGWKGDSDLAARLEIDEPGIQRDVDIEAVRKVWGGRPAVEVVKSLDAPWGRLISEKEYMELSERAFDSLTVDEQDAIGEYADSWFNHINGSLRGVDRRGNAYVPRNSLVAEKTPEYISKINTAMSKAGGAPEDLRLFRGMKDTNRVFPNGLKVGDVFSDKGFVSASSDLDTAFGYSRHPGGGMLFEIEVKRGTQLLPLKNSAELEFLLKPGQSFKVVGSRMDAITLRGGEKLPCEIIRVIAE